MTDERGYTIEAQIACVKREIAMRKNVLSEMGDVRAHEA